MVEALAAAAGPGGPHEHTLLLVMGDHGMTAEGEHGGGLPAETDTALFALSLRRLHRQRTARCAPELNSEQAARAAANNP